MLAEPFEMGCDGLSDAERSLPLRQIIIDLRLEFIPARQIRFIYQKAGQNPNPVIKGKHKNKLYNPCFREADA